MDLLTGTLTGHFAATTPMAPPVAGTAVTYLQRMQTFATLFWRLNESNGVSGFNEGSTGGGTLDFSASAGAQAALEYAAATLAQDDTGGRCLGFQTHASSGVTALTRATNAAFDVTQGGWGCLVQVDDLNDKHVLIAREEGTAADGNFGLEILSTGAVRSWRRTAGSLKDISTPAGTIAIGQAYWLWTDFGAEGLRIFVDGALLANEASPTTTWLTSTTSGIRIGRWVSGIAGLDGLIGWLVFRNTQPSTTVIAGSGLANVQNVRLLTGTSVGSVEDGSSLIFNVRDYGHLNAGCTANIVPPAPTDVNLSVSGEQVTVTGVNVVASETFDISATHDAGTTAAATFSIAVTAPPGGGEFITTPELWGWDTSGTTLLKTTDFNQAIADANANAV